MAQPLEYASPKAATQQTAHEELADLLETLHRSGALRVASGLAGQFEEVNGVVLDKLATPGGRNALNNLLILLRSLTELDADRLDTLTEGVTKGLGAAEERLADDGRPPGLIRLFAQLRDRDTRRGLAALLALLQTLGGHLHDNLEDGEKS